MKHLLRKIRWRNLSRAETLLEVMFALVVLVIGSASATSMILTAIDASIYNKDSLIALNLAQEGIEYMRNLRDTNWMKYSANPKGCWNARPSLLSCTGLAPTERLPATNTTNGMILGDVLNPLPVTPPLNLANGVDNVYILKNFDLNPLENSDNEYKQIGALTDKNDDYDFIGSFKAAGTFVDNTKFYRSINIDYKLISGPPYTIGPASPTTANLMVVTSTVQWLGARKVTHKVVLTSLLASYK